MSTFRVPLVFSCLKGFGSGKQSFPDLAKIPFLPSAPMSWSGAHSPVCRGRYFLIRCGGFLGQGWMQLGFRNQSEGAHIPRFKVCAGVCFLSVQHGLLGVQIQDWFDLNVHRPVRVCIIFLSRLDLMLAA